jgi:hypothetical protein
MNIPERQIQALTAFGYTVSEARFLYIVAMDSGYFTARQFLAFVNAKRGYRTHSLAQKLITQGHATMREYRRNGCIYHLYSRKLYAQLGHENLRNRRRHRLEAIRTRLLALDFILANQGYQYLETEAEKVAYFYDQLHIEKVYLPVKLYMGGAGSHPTLRYFVDKFPLFLSTPRPGFSPVVTFSFIDPGLEALTGFLTHLGQYETLFRELADFRFLYISGTPAHFEKATELFNSQVKVPLESDIAGDLIRYFRTRSIWSSSEFKTMNKTELLFLDGAKRRFAGDRFEALFKPWKAGRIAEADLRAEFPSKVSNRKVYFETFLVPKHADFRAKDDE